MNPIFTHGIFNRPLSRPRKVLALCLAVTVDGVRQLFGGTIGFLDPIDDAADVATAFFLWLIIGPSWALAMALLLEVIPGVAVFPSWTALSLVVLATAPRPASTDDLNMPTTRN